VPSLNISYISDPIYNPFVHGFPNPPGMLRHDAPFISNEDIESFLSACNVSIRLLPLEQLYQFSSAEVMRLFIQSKESQAPDIGDITSGHHSNFRAICQDPSEYFQNRVWLQEKPLGTLARSIGKYGRPTYVHGQALRDALKFQAKIDIRPYFETIEKKWGQHLGRYGEYMTNIRLPFCLSFILDRAKSRVDIFDTILDMREEFDYSRKRLWNEFEDAILRCPSEAESVRQVERIRKSAEQVIPSGLRRGEFYSPLSIRWLGRLVQWLSVGPDTATVAQFADDTLSGKYGSLHSIDLSELLAGAVGELQPYHHLIQRHLSQSEIDLLASSSGVERRC
jgi:hypothetical protein